MVDWPVELRGQTPTGGDLVLGPLRRRDRHDWTQLRARNREWLAPWEATPPDGAPTVVSYPALVRYYRREARAGRMLPFVLRLDGQLVGQLVVFGISWGSLLSGAVGYWVDERVAGRGVAPTALALAVDHALGPGGLHRIEVNIRPENANSLAVVRKLAFRDEGVRAAYLHIDGSWRDHRTFALTREDLVGERLLDRLHTNHTSHIGDTPPHVPGGPTEAT